MGRVTAMLVAGLGLCMSAVGAVVDAHKPVTYHFAVTNTMDKLQTIESVRTSCACLKVLVGSRVPRDRDGRAVSPLTAVDATVRVPPGGVIPFEVEFNPAGMEGHVEKRVWVTLTPSKKIVTFDIAADVRQRLGFKPMDAAFGVIRRSDTGREIVAKLSGYAMDGVALGTPFISRGDAEARRNDLAANNAMADNENKTGLTRLEESKNPDNPVNPVKETLCASASLREDKRTVFDVRLAPDGKGIIAKFRERNVLPGIYSEVWTISTSDKEIPEITFAVSARVADAVSVTPQVITVGWDEPVCSRMVMVRNMVGSRVPRGRNGRAVSPLTAADATGRIPMRILSAETKPRKWGDVKITPRPMNGWRIDIENIDPREVRQFSKRPFLEVKTNLPEMESFAIPLRVVNDGGAK